MSKKLNSINMSSAKSSIKRSLDSSSADNHKANKSLKTSHHNSSSSSKQFEEPRFTFDEVKDMIEKLLAKQTKATAAANASLKKVDFDEIKADGHSVEGCKELFEQLVYNTRRVRTLQEVLIDIRDNLNKRTYTEIIHRATLKGALPKKPPSAYLLYHQDRYNELREENPKAVEVSKIVAEEWRTLSDRKRREYQKRQEELVRKFEEDMEKLGLIDEQAPKRPKSARQLFIDNHLTDKSLTKEGLAEERERLSQAYDQLSSSDKQKWMEMFKQSEKLYQKEREEYIASHPHLNHSQPEKKARSSERSKLPEAPKSALKFFLQKKLPENLDNEELEEVKKRLKEKFQHLRERKLLKYIKKAVLDKERYDKEVDEYRRENPDRAVPKTKPSISKEQLKLYARVVENRPSLPAPTAYLHYCSKMLTDMNDNDDEQVPTARMQTASVAWKNSSDFEKKQAEREHMQDIERYVREMEAWLATRTEERKAQILSEEPKANPDYWKKKLNRMKKLELKRERLPFIQTNHQQQQQFHHPQLVEYQYY